jgi:protein TonB
LTLLVAAAILHGLMLMLPVVRVQATLPAAIPAPDFPRVWRFDPPAPPATRISPKALSPAPVAAAKGGDPVLPPTPAAETAPAPPARALTLSTEPVPEPAPDVTMRLIASEVQAHIPYPDAPPPPMEPGPSFGAQASPRDDGAPRVVARTRPVYPVAARSVSAEGMVTLRVFVLPDGRVERASVLDCSRPGVGFEAAAVQAVKRWRYEPAPQATSARSATVTIDFKKEDGRP